MPSIEIDGCETFYRSAGQGKPALFIHAYLIDSTIWLDQLQSLADVRRCIALDLPGHGRSDPVTATKIDPEVDAAFVARFLDALKVEAPIDLVATGAGGIIAGLLYAAQPQRFSSLTLLSTNFAQGPNDSVKTYQREMARLCVVEGMDAVFRRWDEYIVGSAVTLHARARYKSMITRCRYETMVAFLLSDALKERPELPQMFDVPVFLPYGDEDVVMSGELGRKVLATYRNVPVTAAVPKAARLLPLENPTALNESIRAFWRDHVDGKVLRHVV
jgi:pimeloyl-ACP methyl ester carboxylesterase